ncbi:unnamed protein product [Parascedosporium putredinis]|uniref:Peptidase S53 domain-containing protein n=1 Tax=Parascedosporium putredinis TaxID=1442378 RepID=A0A9P1GZE7_9PEZI|nr:unnamed protein product [Parascedosporium putredinis]CAI7991739.1 unnamed protein product [Parascedosporium putredinis]
MMTPTSIEEFPGFRSASFLIYEVHPTSRSLGRWRGPSLAALLTELFTVEHVPELAEGWSQLPEVPNLSDILPLSISIKNDENMAALKQRLAQISDPKHKDFGKHLSAAEVRTLRRPPQDRTDTVLAWLAKSGLAGAEVHDDWIKVNSTVREANDILGANIAYFALAGKQPVMRSTGYGVEEGGDKVARTESRRSRESRKRDGRRSEEESKLTRARIEARREAAEIQARQVPDEPIDPPEGSVPAEKPPCSDQTTPDCLRELYNFYYNATTGDDGDAEAGTFSDVLLLVAGFLEQNLFHPDTHDFMNEYAPYIPESVRNVTIELINGGQDPQIMSKAGMEAALDVQYALSLGYPANIVYSVTGGRGEKLDATGQPMAESRSDNEPYLEFLEYLLAKDDDADLPHVISISYADDEQGVPREYALKVCDLFAALTSRGVSILVATGDGGSRGVRYGDCRSNDGLNRPITMASFPATCPYVTAIGAVNQVAPPQVATFSTGGFSIYFDRPAWQADAVEGYIAALDGRLEGHYEAGGRAIPDVASTPVLAAMFALVNDARARRGLSRTGWLNPRLYSDEVRAVMKDVVGV